MYCCFSLRIKSSVPEFLKPSRKLLDMDSGVSIWKYPFIITFFMLTIDSPHFFSCSRCHLTKVSAAVCEKKWNILGVVVFQTEICKDIPVLEHYSSLNFLAALPGKRPATPLVGVALKDFQHLASVYGSSWEPRWTPVNTVHV